MKHQHGLTLHVACSLPLCRTGRLVRTSMFSQHDRLHLFLICIYRVVVVFFAHESVHVGVLHPLVSAYTFSSWALIAACQKKLFFANANTWMGVWLVGTQVPFSVMLQREDLAESDWSKASRCKLSATGTSSVTDTHSCMMPSWSTQGRLPRIQILQCNARPSTTHTLFFVVLTLNKIMESHRWWLVAVSWSH